LNSDYLRLLFFIIIFLFLDLIFCQILLWLLIINCDRNISFALNDNRSWSNFVNFPIYFYLLTWFFALVFTLVSLIFSIFLQVFGLLWFIKLLIWRFFGLIYGTIFLLMSHNRNIILSINHNRVLSIDWDVIFAINFNYLWFCIFSIILILNFFLWRCFSNWNVSFTSNYNRFDWYFIGYPINFNCNNLLDWNIFFNFFIQNCFLF
jgi:hypothetical protein